MQVAAEIIKLNISRGLIREYILVSNFICFLIQLSYLSIIQLIYLFIIQLSYLTCKIAQIIMLWISNFMLTIIYCSRQWFRMIIITCVLFSMPGNCKFNLKIISPDQINSQIFLDNILDEHYNPDIYLQNLDCTNGGLQLVQFEQSQGDQLLKFQYNGMDISRQDIQISIEPNLQPKPFLKTLNRVYKTFTIDAGCPLIITRNNYYNRVTITILNKIKQSPLSPSHFTYSFLLNCDYMDIHKNFEYGYLFICLLGVLIVIFVSMHPRIFSLRINNKPIHLQINWKGFLIINVIVMGCLAATYGQQISPKQFHSFFGNRSEFQIRLRFVHYFIKHLGLLISYFYVFVCANQIFFQFSKLLRLLKFEGINLGSIFVTKRVITSFTIASLAYICGLWSQNLIFYNTLSCCISVGAIKMFRFRSLKNGVYSMGFITLTVAIVSIWSYYKLPRSYNDYASELSSPLFIEVPDLVNNLYKKCSWISVFDLILPGAILAYLRDHDQNLHSKWHGVYTVTTIFSFIISNIFWVILEALISTNIPFCVVTYPILLFSICLMAQYRNQFETVWEGNFEVPDDTILLQNMGSLKSGKPQTLSKQIIDPLYNHSERSSSIGQKFESQRDKTINLKKMPLKNQIVSSPSIFDRQTKMNKQQKSSKKEKKPEINQLSSIMAQSRFQLSQSRLTTPAKRTSRSLKKDESRKNIKED